MSTWELTLPPPTGGASNVVIWRFLPSKDTIIISPIPFNFATMFDTDFSLESIIFAMYPLEA